MTGKLNFNERIEKRAAPRVNAGFFPRILGQQIVPLLSRYNLMSSLRRMSAKPFFFCLLAGLPLLASGQSLYSPQAGQYAVAGSLPGDQVHPDVSVNSGGGYVVWQDTFADGEGLGISAQRLNENLSGTLNPSA